MISKIAGKDPASPRRPGLEEQFRSLIIKIVISEKTPVQIFAKICQLPSQTFAKAFRNVFLNYHFNYFNKNNVLSL